LLVGNFPIIDEIAKFFVTVLVNSQLWVRSSVLFLIKMNLTWFLCVHCFVAVMCPLYYYHQSHPINLILLGLFTVAISLTVGIVCALTDGIIVLEALILTAAVVVSLTAYTYWAASKGYDFSYLGPILFVSLIVLVLFGIIQVHFFLENFFTLVAIFSHSCLQEIYW
jgi:FtsH-binding integral membrane protein